MVDQHRTVPRSQASRRTFLGLTGVGGMAFLLGLGGGSAPVSASETLPTDPFTLGVASGDPLPDGVVLWTRLAPRPLAADGRGGMPDRDVRVDYEIAEDARFRDVVQRGSAVATPELAHSVHPEITGLRPGREYHYRFRVGNHISPAGRTKTAPAIGGRVERLPFATASCQAWQDGYYTAYRTMATDDLAAVFFLGDYIYEYAITDGNMIRAGTLGPEHAHPVRTLDQYRLRYSLTHTDPDLQAAHAAAPWVMTWDDHEVENNYAGAVSQYGASETEFLARRAAAYQAFYENLPLRSAATPQGPSLRLYRRVEFGSLAQAHVLDTRQYRDPYPAGVAYGDPEERHDPARSILGAEQEAWLATGLRTTRTRWNLLAQQVVMARIDRASGNGERYSNDKWDGFPACRKRVFDTVGEAGLSNFVVLTGDLHRHAATELKTDFDDPDSTTLGTELVCGSISSGGDSASGDDLASPWLSNPHARFYNAQRGYLRCELTSEELRADFHTVDYISEEGAPVRSAARFTVGVDAPELPDTIPRSRSMNASAPLDRLRVER